jgi:Cation/multidrug efflux pump
MAALMGTLPIALSHGAGAESRRPLGVAVVGGLAFSQLITLYVTPVFYTYMDTLNHRMTRWFGRFGKKRGEPAPAPIPAPVSGTGAVAMDGRVAASGGDAAD